MTNKPTPQASQVAPVTPVGRAHRDGLTGLSEDVPARVLLSAKQVAQLARVQRPVVSMWRARFAAGVQPFPEPVQLTPPAGARDAVTQFDGHEVATWLIETGHGNNPEAHGDLSAFSRTDDVDVNDRVHRAVIEALLAHRAVSGTPLTGQPDALSHSAALTDPADRAFRSEILHRPVTVHWERYIDDLVDAAYSVEGAWHRVQRMAAHRAEAGGAGELSDAATDVLARIVLALMPPETLDLALAAGPLTDAQTVSEVLRAAPEHLSVAVAIPETETEAETKPGAAAHATPCSDYRANARHLARYLLVHGEQANTEPSPAALFIARLRGTSPQAELDALDDVVLELDEWQTALVLGPDALLVDPLEGAAEVTRDALLRSGRVRAIVRLPAGWVPAAARQSLALWVIGGSQRGQGIGERISAIGNLRGPALTRAAAADLAADISSVMGSPALARGHAFRHLRVVRTSVLLAGEGPLDARGATPAAATSTAAAGSPAAGAGRRATEYAARIDETLAQLPGPAVTVTAGRQVAPTTVDAQLRQRRLRMVQGARIAREHCVAATGREPVDGYPVIGADEVRAGVAGARRIDRTLLVTAYPRAELSEPGDVIFLSGSHPAAFVDPVGLCVVAYPARILRIVPERQAAGTTHGGGRQRQGEFPEQALPELLVPELIAADLAAAAPGSPWRQIALRRVSGEQGPLLSVALATLQRERMRLEQRVAGIARAEQLLLDGVAAGVALAPRDAPNPTDLHHSTTTEGTH